MGDESNSNEDLTGIEFLAGTADPIEEDDIENEITFEPEEQTSDSEDFSFDEPDLPDFNSEPQEEDLPDSSFDSPLENDFDSFETQESTEPSDSADDLDINESDEFNKFEPAQLTQTQSSEEPLPEETPLPVAAEPLSAQSALENIKEMSDQSAIGQPQIQAAYPFSLEIHGKLTSLEQEKLLTLIKKHQMGFRELDLEPQFERGQVLLPRISEYAGVLIVQSLKEANAQFRLAPSEEIYATESTFKDQSPEPLNVLTENIHSIGTDKESLKNFPVTSGNSFPRNATVKILGPIEVSATLTSTVVEVDLSSEYLDLVQSLKRKLKIKAIQQGANGITHYFLDLKQLSMTQHYRITVQGIAVVFEETTQILGEQVDPPESENDDTSDESHL
ncbi:MAG: hypothetical protein CL678_01550 [Bdellovibrionaceae bacterium]|nr:hypothetical protein [Pseudobdellovibrionaceae bacterium]|tara:strand:+ start:2051 stop:3220 length:1170 start_codon:yes stop_codon:yes gene_type:complete